MPARSVVLEKLVKYNGESHADVTPGEYTQLTGRAGRRGIDVEGHAVVLWQPGLDPRAVAGLASRRTYPLRSSFAPTYNMAVNLVGTVGRERARTLLEQSFAQFQSDRSVVGVARAVARNTSGVAADWAKATCDRGDFVEYARLRAEIAALEAEAARERRSDRRAESLQTLAALKPGDIIRVPAGRSRGWALVHRPRHPRRCGDATAAGAHRGPPGPPAVAHRLPGPACRGRADEDRQAVQSQGARLPAQPGRGVPVQAGRGGPGPGPDPRSGGRRCRGRGDRRASGPAAAAPVPRLPGPGGALPVGGAGAAPGTGERAAAGAGGHAAPTRSPTTSTRSAWCWSRWAI